MNDVLALKDADCGVAMASGADAACQVAQLVLLDSDFAAMPKVVAEGRRVINNIQRASALYLVKNILSFFLALITQNKKVRVELRTFLFYRLYSLYSRLPKRKVLFF